MTPEGKVKRAVQATLYRHREHIYVYMPVPGGYGRPALDYIGICCGLAFAIEAKRKGGRVTPRQERTIEQIEQAGGKVFIVYDTDSLMELDAWLTTVVDNSTPMEQPDVPHL